LDKWFLDMDGVIADFYEGAIRAFGFDRTRLDEHPRPIPWEWVRQVFGLSLDEFFAGVGEDFWAELPQTTEARQIVEMVREVAGDRVCVLTNPSGCRSAYTGKLRWLEANFPELLPNVLVGSAKHFCAGPNSVLVDDCEHNLDSFVAHGGRGVLVPRPWNKLHGRDVLRHLEVEICKL